MEHFHMRKREQIQPQSNTMSTMLKTPNCNAKGGQHSPQYRFT